MYLPWLHLSIEAEKTVGEPGWRDWRPESGPGHDGTRQWAKWANSPPGPSYGAGRNPAANYPRWNNIPCTQTTAKLTLQ